MKQRRRFYGDRAAASNRLAAIGVDAKSAGHTYTVSRMPDGQTPQAVEKTPQNGRESATLALALRGSEPHLCGHGHAPFRAAPRRGSRADQYRQDASRHRAHARSSDRHDRVSAAAAGARELRPDRQAARRARGRADHRRRKDPAAEPVLFRLHRRIDAARPAGRVPRGRRDPALRRPRARPCLHRPAAACARPDRDDVSRRRHDKAADAPAGARRSSMSAGRVFRRCPIPGTRR